MINIKYYIRHIPTAIISFITYKHYYVCDYCKHIHKHKNNDLSNGNNGFFDEIVSAKCAENINNKARVLLLEGLEGQYNEFMNKEKD